MRQLDAPSPLRQTHASIPRARWSWNLICKSNLNRICECILQFSASLIIARVVASRPVRSPHGRCPWKGNISKKRGVSASVSHIYWYEYMSLFNVQSTYICQLAAGILCVLGLDIKVPAPHSLYLGQYPAMTHTESNGVVRCTMWNLRSSNLHINYSTELNLLFILIYVCCIFLCVRLNCAYRWQSNLCHCLVNKHFAHEISCTRCILVRSIDGPFFVVAAYVSYYKTLFGRPPFVGPEKKQ